MQGAFGTQQYPQKNTSGRKEGVHGVPCTADPPHQSLQSATEHGHAKGAILQYGMTCYCPYFPTLTGTNAAVLSPDWIKEYILWILFIGLTERFLSILRFFYKPRPNEDSLQ